MDGINTSTGAADLARLGYKQELTRGVGSFASFAAGFSFVSILTTVFQLFGLGFGFGGAAFFWTWPAVFIGQLLVALNFSTLAARFPVSGVIYQWSSRLAGRTFGWFTGWTMVIGQILTVAVAAIALQAVLPSIWSGFQIVGGSAADSAPTSVTGAQNAVLLGILLLVLTTVINILGIRLMAAVTSTGVIVELVGVVLVIIGLFTHPVRSPEVIFTSEGFASDEPYIWGWLASSLMAAYVMVGFDSAGELSEETHTPRRTTPKTILRALVISGIGGALLIIATLVAAPSLTDGNLVSGGIAWALTSSLGEGVGRLLLITVAVAVLACTLAVQTSGSRMLYSMAREGSVPFHRALARVSPRTGTPVVASIVIGAGAALALLVNIGQSAIFTALSSLCIAMIYLAYLGVTAPLLLLRIRCRRAGFAPSVDETGRSAFSLGRWGILINTLAVIYQVFMVVNLLWPRTEVYDLTGETWWLQWSALLFIALVWLIGVGVVARNRRLGTGLPLPDGPLLAQPVSTLAGQEPAGARPHLAAAE